MSARYAQKVEFWYSGLKAGGTADNDDDIRPMAIIMFNYSPGADFLFLNERSRMRSFS